MYVMSWFAPEFPDDSVRGDVCGDLDSLHCVYFALRKQAQNHSEMIRFTLYYYNTPATADWFKPDSDETDAMTCDFTHEPIC